jgi:hypothetical protein
MVLHAAHAIRVRESSWGTTVDSATPQLPQYFLSHMRAGNHETAFTPIAELRESMHTAFCLREDMFSIQLGGTACSREQLLAWGTQDRLGIIVNSPYGGLGAGLLTLLSVTAFYDVPGSKRRTVPLYPEIYLFHVGGTWGSGVGFDFWPDRKELFLPADPREVLRSINSHAITHLAVPDGEMKDVVHRFKEPEAAHDRLKRCFAYAPGGSVVAADTCITTSSMSVISNFDNTLRPELILASMQELVATDPKWGPGTLAGTDASYGMDLLRRRMPEVSRMDPAYVSAAQRIGRAREEKTLSESLRRIDVASALRLLA